MGNKVKDSDPRVPLRAWRQAYSLSQNELARKAGVTQPQLSRQERSGRVGMTLLIEYAKFFGVTVDELIAGPPQLKPTDHI